MLNGCHHLIGGEGAEPERLEKGGSWVSPGYDGSLCLDLGCGQGLRAWGCTFGWFHSSPPQLCEPWLEAAWEPEGATPLSLLCPLLDVQRCGLHPGVSLAPS